MEETKNKEIVSNEELENVAGGSYFEDAYKAYYNILNKIKFAEHNNTGRPACCPNCGAPVKVISRAIIDNDTIDAAYKRGNLICYNCRVESRPYDWNINKFN